MVPVRFAARARSAWRLKGKYRGQTAEVVCAAVFWARRAKSIWRAHGHPEFDAWRWVEIDELVELDRPV